MEQKEIWRPVAGFEGAYEVSNLGNIRSFKVGNGILMTPNRNKYGYMKVLLFKDGKPCCKNIHRLVAEAFIPNPNNLPQINHKNEDKADNRVENLEWCTCADNCNYGTRNDRVAKALTKKYGVPVYQFSLDGEFINRYDSLSDAGRKTNLSPSSIRHACRGEREDVGGFMWAFAEKR